MSFSPRVAEWAERGRRESALGHEIYVLHRPGRGPTLLLLHGFPSSSYDFRRLLEALPDRAALAFDFLGFGLSDKPPDHPYSLGWQADLTEELVRRYVDGTAFLVAHDMGTSVATELFARELEGKLGIELAGALLFNGSILIERARPTLGQKLLRSPAGPLFSRLTSERFFRRQFGSIFSRAHPLTDREAEDQWALLRHRGGHRLGHALIGYMDERKRHAERWHGAVRDWPKPLFLAWGMEDPVAVPAVLRGLQDLRPGVPTTELEGIGHYPQIEAPERLAEVVQAALGTLRAER